jgi:hypothetical protein
VRRFVGRAMQPVSRPQGRSVSSHGEDVVEIR